MDEASERRICSQSGPSPSSDGTFTASVFVATPLASGSSKIASVVIGYLCQHREAAFAAAFPTAEDHAARSKANLPTLSVRRNYCCHPLDVRHKGRQPQLTIQIKNDAGWTDSISKKG